MGSVDGNGGEGELADNGDMQFDMDESPFAGAEGGNHGSDTVLDFDHIAIEDEFFATGLGEGGTHILKPPTEQLVIEDWRIMQNLFLTGKSEFTTKGCC